MEKINNNQKFALFSSYWEPRVAASLNGQEVKLVKFKGEFIWHHHAREDELLLARKGSFRVEFRDRSITLKEGELLVVPRTMEHRTVADEEVEVVVFEPAQNPEHGEYCSRNFHGDAKEHLTAMRLHRGPGRICSDRITGGL